MTERKWPTAEANRLNVMLGQVLGRERFPVDVEALALEYSKQCFPHAPITQIKGADLPGFEGMLAAHPSKTQWKIVYNSAVRSRGRIRFTLAHEFGHYLLHRDRQELFSCSQQDMEEWDAEERQLETEADTFASYLLMPLDDFRQQIGKERISFELLAHCAERYGVSLTAAALKWIEIAENRAVLVAVRDDHLLWARSNQAAFKSGAVFATRKRTYAVPLESLAHGHNGGIPIQEGSLSAKTWFPKEPRDMPLTELTFVNEHYDYTLALLLMPKAEPRWQREEEEDDDPAERMDSAIRQGRFRR
ncbi:ImmA/IrrE family metallo-endopeptidase [Methylococcus mesophilus]|uniref:ImmA/IrrE family metallo-endopeptidase n=1 Tax=Methylococcus mesophilus TaxID=2993564 RepID=UPI00224A58D2|nr:ImmA/IrrE family metallo-endopeptidase [Methylococcus mesophilus]UZR30750.1 ImmA/IrrE family metallo-endopeptidase [Methylococcus mesophilus]